MPTTVGCLRNATVIGGGPAGLMAAEVLARGGLSVAVYDHMPSVGRKFLLAGRSGLNLTHSEPLETFASRYGSAAERIGPSIRAFSPADLRAWSTSLSEPTFVGSSGRVFPESKRATPLLRSWLRRLDDLGVRFETRHRWVGWVPGSPSSLRFADSRSGADVDVESDVTIFALGGASWPRVGSDASWTTAFVDAGIEVVPFRSANAGLLIDWSGHVRALAGTPLKNVAVLAGGQRVRGDVMITRSGLEGGPVYTVSASVRDAIDGGAAANVALDLQPDLTIDRVVARLAGRRAKESMSSALRRALGLSPIAIAVLRESVANALPTDASSLAALVKAVPVVVRGVAPLDRAISSAGGVSLDAVDDHFMLRAMPGTYVVGEMLDWEAPTGGYLLQATFSTAVAAARHALTS